MSSLLGPARLVGNALVGLLKQDGQSCWSISSRPGLIMTFRVVAPLLKPSIAFNYPIALSVVVGLSSG